MTNVERVHLFEQGILAIEKLEREVPRFPPYISIHNQLLFLYGQAAGQPKDRQGLAAINLGMLAVREVETGNPEAAELFYQAAAEAKKMLQEP